MSRAEDKCDEVEVSRLLAGAAKAVASARYCWLATTAENGAARARPMGRPNENDWTIRSSHSSPMADRERRPTSGALAR